MLLQAEIFKGGSLEMSADPLSGWVEAPVWRDLLSTRILAVVAIILLLINLPDLFRLIPHLLYSYDRPRGAADLEHSLGLARTRNYTALCYALPFCLIADRYSLMQPRWLSALPAEWHAPATLGLFVAFLLLRALAYFLWRPHRLRGEQYATLQHIPYNIFILLVAVMLVTVSLLMVFRSPDATVRTVLLWEIAVFYVFSQIRSSQFLAASGMGFATFLYLCALELLPAASLVAVIELF